MEDVKIVNHIQEYDDMIGAETLHPLVNVVNFSKLPPIRNYKMYRLFGYYAVYLKGGSRLNCIMGVVCINIKKEHWYFLLQGR